MKIFIYAVLLLSVLYCSSSAKDTLATCRIYNIKYRNVDTIEFCLGLINNSESWKAWANGTFQLKLEDPKYAYNPNNITLEKMESDLDIGTLTGPDLPVDKYLIAPQILSDRISINVHGPEDYNHAKEVPKDQMILISKFLLISKNGDTLPRRITWLVDNEYYYQATAYKTEYDVKKGNVEGFYKANDNIEMNDYANNTVKYEVEGEGNTIVRNFRAEYIGDYKVKLSWDTFEEYGNKGFALYRGERLMGDDVNLPVYDTLIAIFSDPKHKSQLAGRGTIKDSIYYEYDSDIFLYKNIQYCYKLTSFDFYNNEHFHDSACVPIPYGIITFAQANPNPFDKSTTISYILDDNVYLTIDLVDVTGKRLARFMDSQKMEVGKHELKIEMPELASAGLYDVIFIAYPVSNPNVEISKAVIKLHYVR